jgi:ring-1,2-phenylacetyl-CoA epoxidase subunit PaaB
MTENLNSLDPRINRLKVAREAELVPKTGLDQFETYEVFFQIKEGKPYEHAGIVHAPNEAMAFLFGKEQFSRRYTCTGLWIVKTSSVYTSPITDHDRSAYDLLNVEDHAKEATVVESFEVFHLKKRGKQQVHVGRVQAKGYIDAFQQAKLHFAAQPALQVWVIKSTDLLFSDEADKDLWFTLPEKKYRDAIAYKSADKINAYKERMANH